MTNITEADVKLLHDVAAALVEYDDQPSRATEVIALAHKLDAMLQSEKPKAPKRWLGQLMYKHRGMKRPQFENLGPYEGTSDETKAIACKKAEEWLQQSFKEDEIEEWEVRMRPV